MCPDSGAQMVTSKSVRSKIINYILAAPRRNSGFMSSFSQIKRKPALALLLAMSALVAPATTKSFAGESVAAVKEVDDEDN